MVDGEIRDANLIWRPGMPWLHGTPPPAVRGAGYDGKVLRPTLLDEPRYRDFTTGPVSHGITSAGIDLTLGEEFYVFKKPSLLDRAKALLSGEVIDQTMIVGHDYADRMERAEIRFVDVPCSGEATNESTLWPVVVIPAHSAALGHSAEWMRIPEDRVSGCIGKSTYARFAIDTLVTPLEPGWEGQVTLEFVNNNHYPVALFVGLGCVQIQLHSLSRRPDVTYNDRAGKYQGQTGVTFSRRS